MRKYLFILMVLVLASLLRAETITCSGSTTVLPIAQAAAEAFMDKYPHLNVSVRGGGSGVGIAALQNGTAQIANSSRPIKNKELVQARSKGVQPTAYAIAYDGIAMVVHPSNKIDNISLQQILDIYTGKINNWRQLGGADQSIVVISRDVASGTFEVFNEKALNGAKVEASAQMLASNNAVISAVSTTPGAIGYAGLGYVNDNVRVVKVEGIRPSKATVADFSYPLARKLYMYTNGKATGNVAAFLGFIQGESGQKIVEECGFISLQ